MKALSGVLAVVALALIDAAPAAAAGGDNGESAPTPPPTSTGSASVVLNTLEAGAGGTYTPLPSSNVPPGRTDQRNPLDVPPPPDPEGKSCPTTTTFHLLPGIMGPGAPSGIVAVLPIYPAFTRNSSGGYDGRDTNYGYNVANAIPPGGDPSQATLGSLATASTMGGHVIAVDAWLQQRGTWQDATPGVPPYGGSCQGASFTFGRPFLAGNAPPPTPPLNVLSTPPFALGPALMAEVTGKWRIGRLVTLPGPSPTAPTYVHIPTCAWLDSGVPSQTIGMHAVKTTVENGVTLFLVYNLIIRPGAVTWTWGDGASSQTAGIVDSAPSSLPTYDPTTQTWTDPCTVSHAYATVADARTITASQTFSVSITVSWDDGVANHTAPVRCDPLTGGACQLTVGAGNGWTSGPHPVEQIESVPYTPT